MEEKIILGVDPGTLTTGWGVIQLKGNKHLLLGFGTIKSKSSDPFEKKYLKIFTGICEVIEKYQVTALSVETQYVDKNVQSAIKLGMARGVIVVAAAKSDIPVFEYTPSKAKQAVTGRGSATKGEVGRMIRILLSLNEIIKEEDASDALAIALAHAHYSRRPLCLNI